jgi:hypothetical protein
MPIARTATCRFKSVINHRLFFATVLAAIAPTLAGCGGARYDKRMEETKQRLMHTKPFQQHLFRAPTDIEETGVSLRVPKLFDKNATLVADGETNDNGDPIGVDRMQPPFLKLPGFLFGYEKYVPLGERKKTLPVYVYFAVVECGDRKTSDVAKELRENLTGQIESYLRTTPPAGADAIPAESGGEEETGDAEPVVIDAAAIKTPEWEDKNKPLELDTPEPGTTIPWWKVSVTGNQLFFADVGQDYMVEGRLDLYLHASDVAPVCVIVGFRAPTDRLEQSGLFEAARPALGTLAVEPREEEDAEEADE